MKFLNRDDAGQKLLEKLQFLKDEKNVIILGLPRGGVVVAKKIAENLKLPLDIIITRKIGFPQNEELAIGAVDDEGNYIINEFITKIYSLSENYIQAKIRREALEAKRRLKEYRKNKKTLNLKNKIAVLIDDGIATGFTMKAAINSCLKKNAAKIIIASPVIAKQNLDLLAPLVDKVIYVIAPEEMHSISQYYKEFEQTTDEKVEKILNW
ncbi:hypothetical protein A2483_05710 [Candidatus Peregrinibacteria bacterium RIFOXYC2_FULL_33_13]|nr:MAG: Phosphoribosyltransferase [Candidatus Peregrinibacteria bacterium GW2011_GWA2_33_10]KKP40896.1 MAG: phosphoribosyltransferase [Candidatus Peregrinibacteria bacterium GW2011_GWC2_33_13]OGJ55258.1 MAG: hypothetical protein A2483_05710 [Candidatus Peregrinibacteria bacterium RIFOXYC2_FULL_33_13]